MKRDAFNKIAAYITILATLVLCGMFIYSTLQKEAAAQTVVQPNYSNPINIISDPSKRRFIVWKKNCEQCHGNGLQMTDIGIETGAPKNLFTSVGPKTVEEIAEIVANGKNKMPAFKDKLNNDDISMISRYVRIKYLLWVLQEDDASQRLDIIMDNTRELLEDMKKNESFKKLD